MKYTVCAKNGYETYWSYEKDTKSLLVALFVFIKKSIKYDDTTISKKRF